MIGVLPTVFWSIPFPSPIEVNRFISLIAAKTEVERLKFPSPLEVDRFISLNRVCHYSGMFSYRPLAR